MLVYTGPKRVVQMIGLGCLCLVAFFTWMLIDGYDEPRTEEPQIAAVIISLSIATGVLALGLLLTFGKKVVIFDLDRRQVTQRFQWFGYTRDRHRELDEFAAVGVGLCQQNNRPFYFVRLVSWKELWVPGGGSAETAAQQVAEIAAATGLDPMLDAQPVSFFPVFG